jgi:hypothetical protein
MTKRKEWEKLLKKQLEDDGSCLIQVKRKDKQGNIIDLGCDLNNIKIKRGDKCIINCKCGRICKGKDARQIVEKNSLCDFCRHPNGRWDNRSLWKFYNEHKKEFNGEGEEYNWWLKVYKFYVAALQSYKKTHPDDEDLPFLSIKQSRKAGGKNLWRESLEVYESEGVKGLTKQNLNIKKQHFYEHVRGKIKKTGRDNIGYPCTEVCKKLKEFFPEKCKNILSERTEYLKKTFPRECLCFEELYKLHIKPILNILLQNTGLDGSILTDNLFHNNGYSSIVTRWREFGKGIHDVREICGSKLCGENQFICLYGIVHRSQFEMRIFNFLYKSGAEVKNPDNPYPQEFIDATGHRCLDDGAFYSVNQEKWMIIEAWGDNNNKGTKRTNSTKYKNKKKMKQDYWEKNPGKCLQIQWEGDLKKLEGQLNNLFKPHFGVLCEDGTFEDGTFEDIKLKPLTEEELKKCWDYNEEQEILNYLKDNIKEENGEKTFLLYGELPPIMIYKVQKYGGIYELYNKLGVSNEVYKKKSDKIRTEKYKETMKNKTPQEKKATSDKISKSRKSSGAAKGKNNPCFGLKGENHPSYGHHPHIDYTATFIPLIIEYINNLSVRYVNGRSWSKYAEQKGHARYFWGNPTAHNPWKESGFKGVIKDVYKYAEENNISIRKDIMIVDKIPNALSCEENREKYITFVRKHHRKPVEMRDEEPLAIWFRDVHKYLLQDNHQPYWDETKKILDEMFEEEKENMINFIFNEFKTQIKPLYKLAKINGKRVKTNKQVGFFVKMKNKYVKGSCTKTTSKSACFKNRCNTIEECKLEVENWIDSHKKYLLDNNKSLINTNSD